MKLIDNINSRLADDLKVEIRKNSKLAIAASTFSSYAFKVLPKELKNVEELRLIFTSLLPLRNPFEQSGNSLSRRISGRGLLSVVCNNTYHTFENPTIPAIIHRPLGI